MVEVTEVDDALKRGKIGKMLAVRGKETWRGLPKIVSRGMRGMFMSPL
jgi:hypothetical protein